MSYKYTKIVCTLGPASEKPVVLERMLRNGMNVARLNFSHGMHENHRAFIRSVRALAQKLSLPVAIVADLQGPRVRLGEVPEKGVNILAGEDVVFVWKKPFIDGAVLQIPLDHPLYKDLRVGHRILIQDGLIQLRVTAVRGAKIFARAHVGGTVFTHKGVNIPDTALHGPILTEKDRRDLFFSLSQYVDFIALSFVTNADDVRKLRRLIATRRRSDAPKIIVKIERHLAIQNFESILAETDAVMIARGDLGVEMPAQEVPLLQKDIIQKCLRAGKQVIVATQMLESMMKNPRPTRAEASDVANAVIDHTDAVMLSGETAGGLYPVETVKMMHDIAVITESSRYNNLPDDFFGKESQNFLDAFTTAIGSSLKRKLLDGVLVLTQDTDILGRIVARRRLEVPVYAVTYKKDVFQHLVLSWGVFPLLVKRGSVNLQIHTAIRALKRKEKIQSGDALAIIYRRRDGTAEIDFRVV